MANIERKIAKRVDKMRFQPIEVFVIHAVTETFDPSGCMREDWMPTATFERVIRHLKGRYTFISLVEAHKRLQHDIMRHRRYAVLTCDDGFASVLGIMPFLEAERVPITLFVNPCYLDGKSRREGYAEKVEYLTKVQLDSLTSGLVSIGMHGYEHVDATQQTEAQFRTSVARCKEILAPHPGYIPYFAYTWGRNNAITGHILGEMNIVPVLCDGGTNYRYREGIRRRLLPEKLTDGNL